MRQLVLSYGVHVDYLPLEKGNNSQFIKEALNQLEHKKIFNPQNLILVIAGNYGREHGSSYIEVATVENLLKK
jgi:pyruvate kinase